MNRDDRQDRLADLVLNYSVELNSKDKLLIQFDPTYFEYASLIGRKAREIGAEVRYDAASLNTLLKRGLIERYDFKEWDEELARRIDAARWCTSRVVINCDSNPDFAKGIEDSAKKIAEFDKRVLGPYKEVVYRPGPIRGYEVKWNLVGFPSLEEAKAIGMGFEEYSEFVYSATLGNDWKQMSEKMNSIKQAFDNANEVHILVPGLTDLKLSLNKRGGEICDGKLNMPDGEVAYGPVEDSANGFVYFQCPTQKEGLGVVKGIGLRFEKGRVTEHYAKENPAALEEVLNADEGAKRIGELGIGCNYGIKKTVLETLFDEKIGGTVHLALGDSLSPDLSCGGGFNKSVIHWDLICDMREDKSNLAEFPGGKLYVDGKLVQDKGVWKI